ncbi:MAG: c-type cytochrome [Acidiferrobacter sp.]
MRVPAGPTQGARRRILLVLCVLLGQPITVALGASFRLEVALLAQEAHRAYAGARSPRLAARIQSDLGVLGFEARSYCERAGCALAPIKARIERARRALKGGAIDIVWHEMRALHRAYPVDLRGLVPRHPSALRLREGAFLYAHLCAACHATPGAGNPAPDLFALAQSEEAADLAVDILAGVRGRRARAYTDPLSHRQVAALVAYLRARAPRQGPAPRPEERRGGD